MAESDHDAPPYALPAAPAKPRRGGENAQFAMLNRLRREHTRVDVYLVTGTRLQGRVQSFDGRSLLLQTEAGGLLLYHHAVSSVQPSETRARGHAGPGGPRGRGAPPPRGERFQPPDAAPRERSPERSYDDLMERPLSMHRKPAAAPVVVTRKRSRIASLQRDDSNPPKDE